MVLMHKLRQSEQVDLAHFHKSKDEDVDTIIYQTQTLQRPVSPPHRPQTRSQSGRPVKRRVRQDNALDPASSNSAGGTPTKKPRLAQQKRNTNTVKQKDNAPPSPPKDVKFIQADPSIQNEPSNRPGPRTRITIPVPVPNLTKKSRGRRVPTATTATSPERASAGQTRKYVCQVAECGKCFHRGEHLKRHIRSIHTNEKPFKCPAPDCNKTFNRHDNLLQHVKIHAPGKPDDEGHVPSKRKPYATSSLSSLGSTSTRVTISDDVEPEEGREDPEEEDEEDTDAEGEVEEDRAEDGGKEATTKTALRPQQQPQQQSSSYMVMVPYGMGLNPTGDAEQSTAGYNRGAAVSSLRTEMPEVDGGGGATQDAADANEGVASVPVAVSPPHGSPTPDVVMGALEEMAVPVTEQSAEGETRSTSSTTPTPEVIYQLMDMIEGYETLK